MQSQEKQRKRIGTKLRELRLARKWRQRDLAQELHISQPTLSQVENGAASLTAEQFLAVLRLFNASASDFSLTSPNPDAEIQNALAKFGASHLHEDETLLPSERLRDINNLVVETLVAGTPRLITSLAPVLVLNIDSINLHQIESDLARIGLPRRLPWLADNVLGAVNDVLITCSPRQVARRYRRATVVFETYLSSARSRFNKTVRDDILDRDIRSNRTLEATKRDRSSLSEQWGIVTKLQPDDFSHALSSGTAL